MSQRIHHVDKTILVNLLLRIELQSFSNHNGFKDKQINNAIEEFEDGIYDELLGFKEREFSSESFYSVDYVNYKAEKLKESESIDFLFIFHDFMNKFFEYHDNTESGDIYIHKETKKKYSKREIYTELHKYLKTLEIYK